MKKQSVCSIVVSVGLAALTCAVPAFSQSAPAPPTRDGAPAAAGAALFPGYVIGVDDQLAVRFWGDTQLSADVIVRPDGRISLPLLNDVDAAGLTPEQLGAALEKAAARFIAEPDATVIVREIHSRKVYAIGQVGRPGAVPLNGEMNVLQLLASVGGVLEYADKSGIVILRTTGGKEHRFKFNYNDVVKGKNVQQNILLQPGDTVVVN
jgi:polysaccharide export outer membrane protein